MIKHQKNGGRTVELFIPFEYNKQTVDSITLGAFRFGHTMRWNEGAWKSTIELLTELAGVDEAVIRELRYPDADRVMEAFMSMLPADIRDDVVNGRIPLKPDERPPEPAAEPRATNGSGEPYMMGPGVPLPPQPEAGFDLSEEP